MLNVAVPDDVYYAQAPAPPPPTVAPAPPPPYVPPPPPPEPPPPPQPAPAPIYIATPGVAYVDVVSPATIAPPATPAPAPIPTPAPPASTPQPTPTMPAGTDPFATDAYTPAGVHVPEGMYGQNVTVTPAPPASGATGGTGTGGAAPPIDIDAIDADGPQNFNDPESGDGDFSDDDMAALEDERDIVLAGGNLPFAVTHPTPGTVIGTPYTGTHAKAFNVARGSDNWESENADDIWLYPGTHITAVESGVISPAGWEYGLSGSGGRFAGWRLHLVGTSGRIYYYTHMAALTVSKGQHVAKGAVIGHSGVANGVPHLHFAVRPPFTPTAFYHDAFDLNHATAVGTPAKPATTTAQQSEGINGSWHWFMQFLDGKVQDVGVHATTIGSRLIKDMQ